MERRRDMDGGREDGRAAAAAAADVGRVAPDESRSTTRSKQSGRRCVWEKANIFIF